MLKEEVRNLYRQKRRQLSEEEFELLNAKLGDRFFEAVDLQKVKVLHTFLPIRKMHEVDTWRIIEKIRHSYPHIEVAIPRVNTETAIIESYLYEGKDQLETNIWGIPEPTSGIPVANEKIDVVLTPLLAADRRGGRVGYGRGFYDRFLCELRAQKVGLSFFPPEEHIEGMSAADVPLDMLVTPDGVYRFNTP